MLLRLRATRVLRTFRDGGSLPILAETEAGRWVVKLRGSAQGARALIAEIVVGELATLLGLAVPRRALVALSADLPTEDHNDELADLLAKSVGDNVGFAYLERASDLRLDQLYRVAPEQAALVLWLDRLVENRDRTRASTNLMLQKSKVWLIDHGAALPFQHDWSAVDEQTPRDEAMRDWVHLFSDQQPLLLGLDAAAAKLLDRHALEHALELVPDEYLTEVFPGQTAGRSRAAYVAFLHKRLKAPRPFV